MHQSSLSRSKREPRSQRLPRKYISRHYEYLGHLWVELLKTFHGFSDGHVRAHNIQVETLDVCFWIDAVEWFCGVLREGKACSYKKGTS